MAFASPFRTRLPPGLRVAPLLALGMLPCAAACVLLFDPAALPALGIAQPPAWAGLLGFLAGAATLAALRPPQGPDGSGLAAQLAEMLERERQAFAALRQSCDATGHEAMTVGARLASVALDAEERLAATVAQAEQAIRDPGGVTMRAAAAIVRLERALPELAGAIRQAQGAPALPAAASDALAGRIAGMADTAIRNLGTVVADAAAQIAAMGDAASVLRGDALSLDAAGRQIALANAQLLQQLNEAVSHTGSLLERLPDAAGGVGRAAEDAAQVLSACADEMTARLRDVTQAAEKGIAEASAGFRAGGDALDGTLRQARDAADAMRLQAGALLQAGGTAADRLAAVTGHLAGAAADAIAEMSQAASHLRGEADATHEAGRLLTEAGSQAAQVFATGVSCAQEAMRLLPDACAAITAAAARIRDDAADLTGTARRLGIGGEDVAAALGQAAALLSAAVVAMKDGVAERDGG